MTAMPDILCWDDAQRTLLDLASADLDDGLPPSPTLIAFDGETPLATAALRPFGAGEAVQALVELLALLLPLGADRIAFALPGRGWSLDDPVPPVAPEGDLRQRLVLVTCVDGSHEPPEVCTTIHPFDDGPHGWRWLPPIEPADDVEGATIAALRLLVADRHALAVDQDGDLRVAAQLGRVLVLGHLLALSPVAADRLERHQVPI